MILLNDIIEIFRPPDSDQPTPAAHHEKAVHVEQTCRIRSAFVDDDLIWPAVVANGFYENAVAAALSRRSESMKLGVSPCLSMARFK